MSSVRSENVVTINLHELQPDTQKLLALLLIANPQSAVFEAKQKFEIDVPDAGIQTIELSNRIIQRGCESKKYSGQKRYEIVADEKIGAGSFATVLKIAATLELMPDKSLKIEKHKPRVVKMMLNSLGLTHKKWVRFVNNEYAMSSQTHHLHMKKPVYYNNYAFLVMRRLPGVPLNDFLASRSFSVDDRYQFSIQLLKTVSAQTTVLNIVHHDLKPANILVQAILDSSEYIINVVDYALAKLIGEKNQYFGGTPTYAAPELFCGKNTTPAADVFSMSYVVGEAWEAEQLSLPNSSTDNDCLKAHRVYQFYGLFRSIASEKVLSQPERSQIKTLLVAMHISNNPEGRLPFNAAITQFEQLFQARQEEERNRANLSV